jgi:lysophospholipase
VRRADILILTDYGEIAETWFETARDLTRRGYAVWVLDGAGQGGSGRWVLPRDLGYAQDFQADMAAVRAMTSAVIRPQARAPLVILGQGVGAVVAALALQQRGPAPAGLILSSPRLDASPSRASAASSVARLLGLDRTRDFGTGPWRKDMKDDFATGATHDPWRGAVTLAWQRANPDLRMGGPSLRWREAFHDAQLAARRGLPAIRVPALVIEGDSGSGCRELPRCLAIRIASGGKALEIERDGARDAWLAAIDAFIRARMEAGGSQAALQAGPPPIASRPPSAR